MEIFWSTRVTMDLIDLRVWSSFPLRDRFGSWRCWQTFDWKRVFWIRSSFWPLSCACPWANSMSFRCPTCIARKLFDRSRHCLPHNSPINRFYIDYLDRNLKRPKWKRSIFSWLLVYTLRRNKLTCRLRTAVDKWKIELESPKPVSMFWNAFPPELIFCRGENRGRKGISCSEYEREFINWEDCLFQEIQQRSKAIEGEDGPWH
jgi:hypothetical protein